MMFSVFRFAFLVASTFSLVLCIPQIFNGIPNITPFDVASLPSPSVQDHYKSVGSPANGLTGLSGGDSGGATFTDSFDDPINNGNFENFIPELLTPGTHILAQNELNPPSIPNTPTEIRAGEDAHERASPGRLPKFDPKIVRERKEDGYDDSVCNGGSWACCFKIMDGWMCTWMMELAFLDRRNCPFRGCCFPNYLGYPDEHCSDSVLKKGPEAVLNSVGNAFKDFIQREGSPTRGSGSGRGSAGGVGSGVWGAGEGP